MFLQPVLRFTYLDGKTNEGQLASFDSVNNQNGHGILSEASEVVAYPPSPG